MTAVNAVLKYYAFSFCKFAPRNIHPILQQTLCCAYGVNGKGAHYDCVYIPGAELTNMGATPHGKYQKQK